jgi:peptidoglycan/xylan/chitin deacetylase (PgdA/CDA1 family)
MFIREKIEAEAIRLARRAVKGAAALLLYHSGAREALSGVQRRAVGGRRVLILSYHRVVGDFREEEQKSLPTLNIARETFRKHLLALRESHDIVSLDDAIELLRGDRKSARDVAAITFDDGYRDVYTHAFPVLRELRVPAIVYVPSAFIGTARRLGHDRLFAALRRMDERNLNAISVGVGGKGEQFLLEALEGRAPPAIALERLIARFPTPDLLDLATALEVRLGLSYADAPEGQLAMTWEMLREMGAHGIATGAHTADHTVLINQSIGDARREIAQCKAGIEKNLRKPIRHFAYCNGYYSAGVARALQAEGFVSAVTTEDMPNVPGVDPFALKRKVLWEGSSAGIFGGYSPALAACQFDDTFGVLALQQPVAGSRPTNFEQPDAEPRAASGSAGLS